MVQEHQALQLRGRSPVFDSGHCFAVAGPVYVTVQVTRPSQNPPRFDRGVDRTFTVEEGLMYNTTIATVVAHDPDPGSDEYKHGLTVPKTHIHIPLVQLGVWCTPGCQ